MKALEMTIEIRGENTNRRRDDEDDIIYRIKILSYLTISLTKIFSDWMADLDYCFDWYRYTKKVGFSLHG